MKEFLVNTFNISDSEASIFFNAFDKIALPKGETFIEYGKMTNCVGFVEKGILKCTLIGKEKSVIDDFIFENQFVANYYSFLQHEKSNKEITTLQNSVLKVITREQLDELGKQHPFISKIAMKVAEQLFISTSKKLEDIRLLNAEDRYLKLLKNNKRYIHEIPQYEIASFLNVSPETLSRIRKKVASLS